MVWNFIDTGLHTGKFNMLLDESIAEKVANGSASSVLRFFQWQPYCISLGKNQKIVEINTKKCKEQGVDVVYRPTGGRAILHAEELTYSVVFNEVISGSIEETYRQISEALVQGLRKLEIPAEVAPVQADFRALYKQASSAACFSSSAKYEIQVQGKKLVGSAQRRFAGSVLQHGSILIGSYHRQLTEFLNLNETEKETMSRILQDKTIEIEQIRKIDLNELKLQLKLAFEERFGITFREPEEDLISLTV
ncbi:lipoate--protein ligase family protein [bacterium]|nr:lipoate--protein ligase family protein [bacterium]